MTEIEQANLDGEAIGAINIAPEVIEIIASTAAFKVKGVHRLAWHRKAISDFFSKGKDIILYQNEVGETVLQVSIATQYGLDIPKTALYLQKYIYEQVYFMTDIEIDYINVIVEDIFAIEQSNKNE